jgi:Ala-tRNA(Pro) deacylase
MRYVLAVVPGDRRVDLGAVRDLNGARCVGFCDSPTAERLARSASGTVLPFSFDPDLEVVADVSIEASTELYFIAARLDRSVMMRGGRLPDDRPTAARVHRAVSQWW